MLTDILFNQMIILLIIVLKNQIYIYYSDIGVMKIKILNLICPISDLLCSYRKIPGDIFVFSCNFLFQMWSICKYIINMLFTLSYIYMYSLLKV